MVGRIIVLGAGASRGVSYANEMDCPSPLDKDFFDLLGRLESKAKGGLWQRVKELPYTYRRSMELAFYNLHLHDYLGEKFNAVGNFSSEDVISDFVKAIQLVLRKAHGMEVCTDHQKMFRTMKEGDSIISFNYDLVAERALREKAEDSKIAISPQLYGLESGIWRFPHFKLHGSSNWELPDGSRSFSVHTKNWSDFDDTPGYVGHKTENLQFPIMLPFWDKRVEKPPWLSLWKRAFNRVKLAKELIVWGYSLPQTDVKAQQFFTLARGTSEFRLCVIDPAKDSKERWREIYPDAMYWEYNYISDFIKHPPKWWNHV